MKFSAAWLREWVNPQQTQDELCQLLTMSGFEVEAVSSVAAEFSGVVTAEVVQVDKHPAAERLHVCLVDVGGAEQLTIVCGAPQVRIGMKVAAARVGAQLPNHPKIVANDIRGIRSHGMLCSAKELGLSEDNDGLYELPDTVSVGEDLWRYLSLSDSIIDLSLTPNRGDCLSIQGIAREVAALTQTPLNSSLVSSKTYSQAVEHSKSERLATTFPVTIHAAAECPHYVGRVICNVRVDVATPIWLQERLRRSGMRSINPVVDVTNYVMLELGQPMHAFDWDKLSTRIDVRLARAGETITLLDGREVILDAATLLIADPVRPLAVAGVMGGVDSGVSLLTKNIFLESAFFHPACIARQRQRYAITSESARSEERGVDPELQVRAITRATQLLLEICGGEAGPLTEVTVPDSMPQPVAITLAATQVQRILGMHIPEQAVAAILHRLNLEYEKLKHGWRVQIPSYRFDLRIAEDLVEEIARLYGYDKIPVQLGQAKLQILPQPENQVKLTTFKNTLRDLGYHEVVTYSFVDKQWQDLLDPMHPPKELLNPITTDMGVMRTSLWPGLIGVLLHNKSRQQERVRIFESGLCFIPQPQGVLQQSRLGGLVSGSAYPQQWGQAVREVDFFDLKGDLQTLLQLTFAEHEYNFQATQHPVLHPGQAAAIYHGDEQVGVMGALHPFVLQELNIFSNIFIFDLNLTCLEQGAIPFYREVSKYPEIHRDIAIVLEQSIPARVIQATIKEIAHEWLKDMTIFDVYQGQGIAAGFKSVALSFVLQHPTRTLVEEEVARGMDNVVQVLRNQLGAELRS